MVKQSDISSVMYEGADSMLGKSFAVDSPISKCHPDFKAQLRLKNGDVVDAPPKWRRKIWMWWISNRRSEVMNDVLIQVSNDILGRNR
ncbi:MAG: hypothetical protein EHM34_04100 [Nitrosopumilales archaeon]|nr:MAG: hypothetical protein EHM34_04100 [Nitrosopumilales archaeon]